MGFGSISSQALGNLKNTSMLGFKGIIGGFLGFKAKTSKSEWV
jgi:hypothetical protein